MRDDIVYYTDLYTGMRDVVKGATTKSVADQIANLLIVGAGYVPPPAGTLMALFTNSLDAMKAYQKATGTWPVTGATYDFIQVGVHYNYDKKYSYRYMQFPTGLDWALGAITDKAVINKIQTDEYYVNSNGGKLFTSIKQPAYSFPSPNFNSPDAIAYQWAGNAWIEKVNYKIPNTNHEVNF